MPFSEVPLKEEFRWSGRLYIKTREDGAKRRHANGIAILTTRFVDMEMVEYPVVEKDRAYWQRMQNDTDALLNALNEPGETDAAA